MKNNRLVIIGMMCCALALVTVLVACQQDVPYEGNTEEKILVITGASQINGSSGSAGQINTCYLRESVTGIAKAQCLVPITIGDNVTLQLYQVLTVYKWRGNGDHYIEIIVKKNDETTVSYWYTKGAEWTLTNNARKRVNFSQKIITLPWSDFKQQQGAL